MSERDVFIAALQREDPAERRAYLDAACALQPDLRRQVEHLLRLPAGAGSFLEEPAVRAAATGALPLAAERASSPEAPGALLGPYKLLQPIGEGGMGTVWMAQQTAPVRRLVAVKLIKARQRGEHPRLRAKRPGPAPGTVGATLRGLGQAGRGRQVAEGVGENDSETVTAANAERRVLSAVGPSKAAGGVLTAKQAPHRPGTAPAPGLRAGRDVPPWYRRPHGEQP